MTRYLAAAVVLWAAAAYPAQEGHSDEKAASGEAGEEKHDVADFIFHHVADSNEYEFEIPLRESGSNPVIHLPVIRIPLKANACP